MLWVWWGAVLATVAADVEARWGTLAVPWGEVLRFRRGGLDLPGNGAPEGPMRASICM